MDRLWWLDLRGSDVHVREHVVPDLYLDVVFCLGSPYVRDRARVACATFEGIGRGPVRFEHVPGNWLVGIRFRPTGLRPFTGRVPVSAFGDHAPLDVWLGSDVRRLLERLAEHGSPEPAWALLEHTLARRCAPSSPRRALVDAGIRSLREDPDLTVASLADSLGSSQRTLLRAFREHVGTTPKRIQRILRVHRALALLDVQTSAAQMALELGFYDQAHLRRELRSLAGGRPPLAEVAVFSKT